MKVRVYQGDLVQQSADAIVNAANSGLRLGGGIDNAIRTAAGPEIEQALGEHTWVSEGTAIVTPAFRLPAKWVIHVVAPRWNGSSMMPDKMEKFRGCHRAALQLAVQIGAESLAFPAIGTGAFKWPLEIAADAAFEAIADWIDEGNKSPAFITFVCPIADAANVYQKARDEWLASRAA